MLKTLLHQHGITTTDLAKAVRQTGGSRRGQPLGRSAMSRLINHHEFPKTTPEAEVKQQIAAFLQTRGIAPENLERLWAEVAPPTHGNETTTEEDIMLPKKSNLSPVALSHFGLRKAPFGDVESDADMYLGPHTRYAREALLEAMRNGGFKALVGESGSGKTTLAEECEEQIRRNDLGITLIRPPIVGMDTDQSKGAPLKARSILMHIMDVISPDSKRPQDLPRFTSLVQRELAARQASQRYCLVIDDAHRLHKNTLCHLKDFYELKLGRQRLLGIVLLGQPDLATRLDPANYEMIQISQRCEIVSLPPLADDLPDYLAARFAAVGAAAANVLADDAYESIRVRLTGTGNGSGRKPTAINVAYPLAVNNLVTSAMNLAAEFGAPKVTADVVKEAR